MLVGEHSRKKSDLIPMVMVGRKVDGTLRLCHVIGDLALVVLVRLSVLARLVLGHAVRQAVRQAVG